MQDNKFREASKVPDEREKNNRSLGFHSSWLLRSHRQEARGQCKWTHCDRVLLYALELKLLSVSPIVLANLCVSHIMTSQNEEVCSKCICNSLQKDEGCVARPKN